MQQNNAIIDLTSITSATRSPTDTQATFTARDTESAATVEAIIISTQVEQTRSVPVTIGEISLNQTYEIAIGTFLRLDPQVDNGFRVPQGAIVVVSLNKEQNNYTLDDTFVYVVISRGEESSWVRLSQLRRL